MFQHLDKARRTGLRSSLSDVRISMLRVDVKRREFKVGLRESESVIRRSREDRKESGKR